MLLLGKYCSYYLLLCKITDYVVFQAVTMSICLSVYAHVNSCRWDVRFSFQHYSLYKSSSVLGLGLSVYEVMGEREKKKRRSIFALLLAKKNKLHPLRHDLPAFPHNKRNAFH